jgi:pSer/pThr/pTyr-binding forkhead associated (FHA) protein
VNATAPRESSEAIPQATLTRCAGVEGEHTYTLHGGVTTLGRSRSNDIVLPDATVSRQHCRITWALDHYVLEDLHSSNGTYLNQEQIHAAFLDSGDIIQIGDQVLQFTLVS